MASSARPELTVRILKRERLLVAAGLAALIGISWYYLLAGAGLADQAMPGMAMAPMAPPPLAALVTMWWLMMVAMMLPSAAPAILLYAKVKAARDSASTIGPAWLFAAGYLLVWLAFSILAALAQRQFTGSSMALDSDGAQAGVLIAAGLYQLSPVKSACLRQCRSPAQFLSRHWRPGTAGALRLGLLHGAYCVGCCWLLMALLFVGGVMNFAWIALLTAAVAAEKLLLWGHWMARISGIVLLAWGVIKMVG